MWRLPPPPLPPVRSPTCQRRLVEGTLVTGQLPSCRASPLLGSSSPRRLAPSSSSGLAPALGRYSPPLCRGNKMAAGVPLCARIRAPPSWPPRPGPGRHSLGVRKHCDIPCFPGRLLCPRPSFCLLLRPCARAHVLEHTPPHIPGMGAKGSIPLLTRVLSLLSYISGFQEPARSSQFPRRETYLLCPEHGRLLRRSLREAFMDSSGP